VGRGGGGLHVVIATQVGICGLMFIRF
jgi:hypothetical protein